MRDYNDVEEVPSIELTDKELSKVSGGKPSDQFALEQARKEEENKAFAASIQTAQQVIAGA